MKRSSEDFKFEKLRSFKGRNKLVQSLGGKMEMNYLVDAELAKMKIDDSPGPGQYSIPSSKSGPKFSIYGKLPNKYSTQTPGPGTYILPKDRVICTKFSPPRSKPSQTDWHKLGPGTYTPVSKAFGPRWGFGQSKRSALQISESPGPGSYNIPSLTTSRAFSIYSKISEPLLSSSPGPGSYEPKPVEKTLKFSLYPKIPTKIHFSTPGPGTYTPNIAVLRNIRR